MICPHTITIQLSVVEPDVLDIQNQDRAITLREGDILQSFPPDYQFSPSNVEVPIRKIARHIGNAVPPRLGEVIGESIIRSLPKKRQKKATIANERERIQT